MLTFVKITLIFAAIGVFGFALYEPLFETYKYAQHALFPCQDPITYSIGSFDNRFGISREEFLTAIAQAEDMWESAVGKELFISTSFDGDVTVHLVFDSRQEATLALRESGILIKNDKTSYDTLLQKYNAIKSSYESDSLLLQARIDAYAKQQDAYNKEVSYWNKRKGAPADIYDKLNNERTILDDEAHEITLLQTALNARVDDINALADELNRIASVLHLSVEEFNRIGRQHEGEFEEGTYQSGPNGREIFIYQFNDRGKLVRVLAHELGHALGLGHVEDSKAIMYRLNSGTNETLTSQDISAVRAQCKGIW